MKIGFTGTRSAPTSKQKRVLDVLLMRLDRDFDITEVSHGDCKGSDKHFHDSIRALLPKTKINVFPPQKSTHRAYCEGDVIHPEMEYLERNQKIVDNSDILIAMPKESSEVLRSGTWATIRMAKKKGIEVHILAWAKEPEVIQGKSKE